MILKARELMTSRKRLENVEMKSEIASIAARS